MITRLYFNISIKRETHTRLDYYYSFGKFIEQKIKLIMYIISDAYHDMNLIRSERRKSYKHVSQKCLTNVFGVKVYRYKI